MNIHEYQAKEILRNYKVPVPNGIIILKLTEIEEKLTQFNNYIGTNEKELIQIKNLDELYSDDNDYGGHYSADGNKKISELIANVVI